MIEISDRKYWKALNYHDGLLYCQLLDIDGKNDWRIFKDSGEHNKHQEHLRNKQGVINIWFLSDEKYVEKHKMNDCWLIIPVRDI